MPDPHLRAMIDRRAWFGFAAFVLAAGLCVLMERMGLPERLLGLVAPVMALIVIAAIGLYAGSMRISDFYAGGRSIPGFYVGPALGTIGLGLGFSLLLSPTPQAWSRDWLFDLAIGLSLGLLIASLVTGPLLRASGGFSLVDLIALHFPNRILRFLLALSMALISFLLAWTSYISALDMISAGLSLSRPALNFILSALLLVLLLPGGFRSLIWICAGGGLIILASLVLPLTSEIIKTQHASFSLFADKLALGEASARLLDFNPAGQEELITHMGRIAAIAIGTACLGSILSPALASSSPRQTRKGYGLGLVWLVAFIGLLSLTALSTSQSLYQRLEGQRPERLAPALLIASGTGLIKICGEYSADPVAVLAACRKKAIFNSTLRAEDIEIGPIWLMIGLPSSKGLNATLSGLVATSLGLAALLAAGASALSGALSLSQDAFHRLHDRQALSSRRLAITRLCLVMALGGLAFLPGSELVDLRSIAGSAIALACLVLAPVTVLIKWPRANSFDAFVCLMISAASALWPILHLSPWPDVTTMLVQSLMSAGLGLMSAMFTSFFHSSDRKRQEQSILKSVQDEKSDPVFVDTSA